MTQQIGYPDFTYGLVGPTKLIGTVAHPVGAITVAPPPNTQTLMLFTSSGLALDATVTGVTTGISYPVFPLTNSSFGSPADIAGVPINTAVDEEYEVAFISLTGTLYVCAEQGIRVIVDASIESLLSSNGSGYNGEGLVVSGVDNNTFAEAMRVDNTGVLYATSIAPSDVATNQPPTEILYVNIDGETTNTNILAAPGTGKTYRVFSILAYANNATAKFNVECQNPASGAVYFCRQDIAGGTPYPVVLPLTGFLVKVDTSVVLNVSAGSAGCTLGYQVIS